jgi:ABC-2 type transport system ATP-binding protein
LAAAEATSAEPLLAAHGVSRRFGSFALEPTDLELRAGESVGLVGPNGAGKSTLLALLAGALEPTQGSVQCQGGVHVGWVPQRAALYRRLTARENLELFARLEGERDVTGAADALLEEFSLPADAVAATLSVGNRQRLNVAIALLGAPRVLLLDEPTASLDPEQRVRLWADLAAVPANGGAICFVTQHLDELQRADRVLELRDGRLM